MSAKYMRTNCVNCGAGMDPELTKCQYCGTTYFDLTAIDFTSNDPVALILSLPYYNGKAILRMLAKPTFTCMNIQEEKIDLYGRHGIKLVSIPSSVSANVGVSFQALQKSTDSTDTLFTVEVSE